MVLNRKGSIAMIDAMIFIILLSAVSVTMFANIMSDDVHDGPNAKTVCDDLFSMKLDSSTLFDTEDAQILPVSTLIAANMNSGHKEEMRSFIKRVMDDLVPDTYGYDISMTFKGDEMIVERHAGGDISSEYSCSQPVVGSMHMDVRIRLY